jgi:uracil-DNA glycosylase family 4
MDEVEVLHRQILSCRLCQDAGFIENAAPVVWGRQSDRMMLIGQAPGITEVEARRPFWGRAGKELFRWMKSMGIEEADFRARVYMTAVTKCFPGRTTGGSGDRRPSQREVALCRPWLDAQLALIKPETILLVGSLAIERFFPKLPLSELIGLRFDRDGIRLIPLPHPSGASRWLNAPANRDLLNQALVLLQEEWARLYASKPA